MNNLHHYSVNVEWTGNTGEGTKNYRSYERNHTISVHNKTPIEGSSDPKFRGDTTKYNPEELFVASLSACHMLWYLHLCADAGIVVEKYTDRCSGTMEEKKDGSGAFVQVTLYPQVTIAEASKRDVALQLHERARALCFIANSCNFPVKHQPTIVISGE